VSADPDALPTGAMPPRFRAALSALVGAAAVLAAFCAWIQSDASRKQNDALVTGARQAVELVGKVSASQLRLGAGDNAAQVADQLDNRAGLHRDLAGSGISPGSDALARGDATTARRLAETFGRATSARGAGGVLDEATADSLRTSVFALGTLLGEQNRAIERAGDESTRQSRASFALALTAVAAALLGLAGLIGASLAGRVALGSAWIGLTLALAWSAAALLA
jgi:hypothetical protein